MRIRHEQSLKNILTISRADRSDRAFFFAFSSGGISLKTASVALDSDSLAREFTSLNSRACDFIIT